jgi:hypothetical protein
MDDSFTFRTVVPLRRRLDPSAVKALVFVSLLTLGLGVFAHWVVASERESLTRTASAPVSIEGSVEQPEVLAGTSMDTEAARATGVALSAATAAFSEHRSFLAAGPAQLAVLEPGYIFVDGPSTTTEIVSVAATTDAWAAAAQAPGGMCHWIRATAAGDVTRGLGSECTGSAVLSPPPPR